MATVWGLRGEAAAGFVAAIRFGIDRCGESSLAGSPGFHRVEPSRS